MTDAPAKKSDLGVRTLSAIVMLAVAGGALWVGGWLWSVFVGLISAGVLFEWLGLVRRFSTTALQAAVWNVGGLVYVVIAAFTLIVLRSGVLGDVFGAMMVAAVIGGVIATDVGAYFAGRTIGGPKIAPRISPSKTWAGLAGGVIATALLYSTYLWSSPAPVQDQLPMAAFVGGMVAVIAQAGDFFESWMKRKAGVKDSGRLIPGHGGLFDRVDGLLAVCFVWGVFAVPAFVEGYL